MSKLGKRKELPDLGFAVVRVEIDIEQVGHLEPQIGHNIGFQAPISRTNQPPSSMGPSRLYV